MHQKVNAMKAGPLSWHTPNDIINNVWPVVDQILFIEEVNNWLSEWMKDWEGFKQEDAILISKSSL